MYNRIDHEKLMVEMLRTRVAAAKGELADEHTLCGIYATYMLERLWSHGKLRDPTRTNEKLKARFWRQELWRSFSPVAGSPDDGLDERWALQVGYDPGQWSTAWEDIGKRAFNAQSVKTRRVIERAYGDAMDGSETNQSEEN